MIQQYIWQPNNPRRNNDGCDVSDAHLVEVGPKNFFVMVLIMAAIKLTTKVKYAKKGYNVL